MKKNGFAPLIIILIIAILGAIGYFGYKRLHINSIFQDTINTSNWTTFVSDFGYSIKYPSEWTLGSQTGIEPEHVCNVMIDSYKESGNKTHIYIDSVPYTPSSGCDYLVIDKNNKFAPDHVIDPKDMLNKVYFQIGGVNAIGFEEPSTGKYSPLRYVAVFDRKETRFTIMYEEVKENGYVTTREDWKNKKIFDTILSTFKFNN